jgi:hypothetical protein
MYHLTDRYFIEGALSNILKESSLEAGQKMEDVKP